MLCTTNYGQAKPQARTKRNGNQSISQSVSRWTPLGRVLPALCGGAFAARSERGREWLVVLCCFCCFCLTRESVARQDRCGSSAAVPFIQPCVVPASGRAILVWCHRSRQDLQCIPSEQFEVLDGDFSGSAGKRSFIIKRVVKNIRCNSFVVIVCSGRCQSCC